MRELSLLCIHENSAQTEEDPKGAEPLIVFVKKTLSSNKTIPLCIYKKYVQTKEDSKGGKPLVVLGVGGQGGGESLSTREGISGSSILIKNLIDLYAPVFSCGVTAPAPIRLLWLLSLRKESNEEKFKRVYLL